MKRWLILPVLLLAAANVARGANLLQNESFEERDGSSSAAPRYWTETFGGALPLDFTSEHHHGAAAALLVGDGKARMWRQTVKNPGVRTFTLTAFVKADGVTFDGPDDNASIYGLVLYKGLAQSAATHFVAKIPAGTYDWKQLSVATSANPDVEIELVHVSVMGRFKTGRVVVDQVELTENRDITPEALLTAKVDDLLKHLEGVKNPDASVQTARASLSEAKQELANGATGVKAANAKWVEAARAVSHETWAAMFPEAMSDRPVEAQMIYHGIGPTKAECDRYLDIVEQTGCNGVYHSLGSWVRVVHHSDVLPVGPEWKDFDALAYSIAEAKKRGIKSFGYVASLYGTYSPPQGEDSLYTKHPEWFAKGPIPNMPTFPDPAHPEVVELVVKTSAELARRYDLDGIGLDYIRYPTPVALNFDENNRRQILERYGIDIMEGEVWKDPIKWNKIREYRAEKVGHIIQRVREAVRAVKPDMPIIACLSSYPDKAHLYGQRWENSSKWLDYASPMNYDDLSADLKLLETQSEICKRNGAAYIPAIGGMPETHQAWTISKWAERVAIQRKNGCDGIIIYRMGGFDPAVSAFFGNGPFYAKSQFPQSPRK